MLVMMLMRRRSRRRRAKWWRGGGRGGVVALVGAHIVALRVWWAHCAPRPGFARSLAWAVAWSTSEIVAAMQASTARATVRTTSRAASEASTQRPRFRRGRCAARRSCHAATLHGERYKGPGNCGEDCDDRVDDDAGFNHCIDMRDIFGGDEARRRTAWLREGWRRRYGHAQRGGRGRRPDPHLA